MKGIKTIIPANGWRACVRTENNEQIFPVAVWALTTENRIQGMVATGMDGTLQPLPSNLPVTYRHVSEYMDKKEKDTIILDGE